MIKRQLLLIFYLIQLALVPSVRVPSQISRSFLGKESFLQSLHQALRIAGSHLDIVSGESLFVVLALGPPVSGHKTIEAPLVTKDSGEKIFVLGSRWPLIRL